LACEVSAKLEDAGEMNAARCPALVALLVLAACAVTEQVAPVPDLSRRIDDPRKARIYVFRLELPGHKTPKGIFDNDERVGAVGPGSFLCWERWPGEMALHVTSKNRYDKAVTVAAGQVYYFLYRSEDRVTTLEQIAEASAREYLKNCRPASAVTIPKMSE
jgi:hypothetical protein